MTQPWEIGSLFTIPLDDGSYSLGQVEEDERPFCGGIAVSIYNYRGDLAYLKDLDVIECDRIYSVVFVGSDALDSGRWEVIGSVDTCLLPHHLPFYDLKDKGYVGARIYGTEAVEGLANAFYSLRCWDAYYRPNYLDEMLLNRSFKPAKLLFRE